MNRVLSRVLALLCGFGVSLSVFAISRAATDAPDVGSKLGVLDFEKYCRDQFGDRSASILTRSDIHGWRCSTVSNGIFGTVDIDPSLACVALYEVQSYAKAYDQTWPYSWECFVGR